MCRDFGDTRRTSNLERLRRPYYFFGVRFLAHSGVPQYSLRRCAARRSTCTYCMHPNSCCSRRIALKLVMYFLNRLCVGNGCSLCACRCSLGTRRRSRFQIWRAGPSSSRSEILFVYYFAGTHCINTLGTKINNLFVALVFPLAVSKRLCMRSCLGVGELHGRR